MSSTVPGGAEAEASGSGQISEPGADRPQADSPPPDLPHPGPLVPAPAPLPKRETDAQPQAAQAAEEPVPAPAAARKRKVRLRRTRRFFRRPTVRVVSALLGVFVIWVGFSAGQATFQNNGQGAAANLAEWARNHYLGPVVTFGEWLSYNPPKVGGKPTMSLAVPKGEQLSPATATKAKDKRKEFVPDIPGTLTSLAGKPITGEGQWRVVEKVNREPALLTTFLRDATYTSYVNGIASIDQRLVRFYLRPGYEDPGYGNWKAPNDVPSGSRAGLLATFNGGFKISDAGGGLPQRRPLRRARQRRRVDRLLQERHDQDRRVGP